MNIKNFKITLIVLIFNFVLNLHQKSLYFVVTNPHFIVFFLFLTVITILIKLNNFFLILIVYFK